MPRYGFIRDKLDIKFLILYLLSRTAAPIDLAALAELAMCDGGVDYFSFTQSVSELVETGHLELEQGMYMVTPKGRKTGAICEDSLPFSVRRRCDQSLSALNLRLRQESQVRTEIFPRTQETGFTVRMSLDDAAGSLMTLDCFAASQEQAQRLADGFLAGPDRVYQAVLNALLDREQAK